MKAVELGYQFRMIEKPRHHGCDTSLKYYGSDKWLRSVIAKAGPYSKKKRYAENTKAKIAQGSLAAEFEKLVVQWKEDTFAVSSLTKKYNHPAYIRIMAMGKDGIRLVLQELQRSGGRWFYALKFMAGENVSEGMDNFEDAKAAWLEWGLKNHYL